MVRSVFLRCERLDGNILEVFLKEPLFVFLGMLIILLVSSRQLPPTWDEGAMDLRSDRALLWSSQVLHSLFLPWDQVSGQVPPHTSLTPRPSPLAPHPSPLTCMADYWTGTISAEGHPQGPVILAALGKALTPSFLPAIYRLRIGAILLFSFALAVVFVRLRADFGLVAARFGILSIPLVPRLFAHAQIAAWDSMLTSSWLITWALFPLALRSTPGAVLFGAAAGMTAASKFPGAAVIVPPLVWLVLQMLLGRNHCTHQTNESGRMELLKKILIAGISALFVFVLLNPPLWFDPVTGIKSYIHLNTHRTLSVAILFFGTMYDLHHSLPWYNTILWALITVPLGLLILFVYGSIVAIRESEWRWNGLFLFLNMSIFFLMRALPGTPVHDGVRLFVTAFSFVAIFAGIGASVLWDLSGLSVSMFRRKVFRRVCVVGLYVLCLFNMLWYAPQWLSFYNIIVGGLPGAVRAGMEPTYYWDGLDGEVIQWLREHTTEGDLVAFSSGSSATLDLYRRSVYLPLEFEMKVCSAPMEELQNINARYYVLQCRPSAQFEWDESIRASNVPVYIKTIRRGGFGPWNLGSIPLLEIYTVPRRVF